MKKKRKPRAKMPTHEVELVLCPMCGHKMDAATNLPSSEAERPPMPGDFTICLRCGAILRFGPEMKDLVPAVGFELYDDLPPRQRIELLKAQKIIRQKQFQGLLQILERQS